MRHYTFLVDEARDAAVGTKARGREGGREVGLVLPWEKMRAVKVGRSRSEGGREKVGLYPCTRGGKCSFLSLNTEEYLFVGAKIGHLPWMLVPN